MMQPTDQISTGGGGGKEKETSATTKAEYTISTARRNKNEEGDIYMAPLSPYSQQINGEQLWQAVLT